MDNVIMYIGASEHKSTNLAGLLLKMTQPGQVLTFKAIVAEWKKRGMMESLRVDAALRMRRAAVLVTNMSNLIIRKMRIDKAHLLLF